MDELRARAYLDLLLDQDSRPRPAAGNDHDGPPDGGSDPPGPPGDGGSGPGGDGGTDPGAAPGTAPAGPRDGLIPAGFVGRVNMAIPLATVLDLADRPGEIPGIGPIDPALARDLARSAARNPRTTWCVTVTDADGHAIGHGCGRPEQAAARTVRGQRPGSPGGHDPPGPATGSGGPGFSFTSASAHGPPGGYGTWRLATGIPGQRDLIIPLGPIATGQCDHRHEARRPRSRCHAETLVPGPARHVYRPDLPAARRPVRLRAQHALRGRRPDLPVQRRSKVQA